MVTVDLEHTVQPVKSPQATQLKTLLAESALLTPTYLIIITNCHKQNGRCQGPVSKGGRIRPLHEIFRVTDMLRGGDTESVAYNEGRVRYRHVVE